MLQSIKRIWRDTRGVSAIEFALIIPILSIVAAGTVEFGRMILLAQKLQNGTFILADLAARDETLSEDQLDNLFLAVDDIMDPYEFAELGIAIVTSITIDDDEDPVVNWQRNGAGSLEATSEVGAPGEVADLPENLPLVVGETVMVAELFYDFEPIFGISAAPAVLRRVAYVKPRLGTLTTLAP